MSTTLIKKHLVLPFLNSAASGATASWVQIKKATDFVRSMNPVTEDRDYISDEHPTTEITDYKPSIPVSITSYKGEPDFDFLYEKYKARSIGSDAQTDFLLVSLFESSTVGENTYYYAEKTNCTLAIDEWNISGNTLSATIYENGTPTTGYVTITTDETTGKKTPTFTAGDMPTE